MNMTNNDNNKLIKRLTAGLGLVIVLGLAGCGAKKDTQVTHGEDFADIDAPRAVNRFADAQIASGARADSTLSPAHFDADQLNSLGRQKLRYMLKDDDACEQFVVYLDIKGDDAAVEARRAAALAFLTDEGLLEQQVQFKSGPNLEYGTSAAGALNAAAGPSTSSGKGEVDWTAFGRGMGQGMTPPAK